MPRPKPLIIIVVLLTVSATFMMAQAVIFMVSTTDVSIAKQAKERFLFSVVWFLQAYGLWQLQRWAWGLLLFGMIMLIVDRINDVVKSGDFGDFAPAAIFVPLLAMLVSKTVRDAVWLRDAKPTHASVPTARVTAVDQPISLEAKVGIYQVILAILSLLVSLLPEVRNLLP